MRTLIIADATFYAAERAMLRRLAVALAGEGVGVGLALPASIDEHDREHLITEPVLYHAAGGVWDRPLRVGAFLRTLAALGDAARPDVIHAFGGGCWAFAAMAASRLEIPLVVDVWRAGLVPRARGLRASPDSRVVCTTPDRWIERQILRDASAPPVRVAHWPGVCPAQPASILREGRAPSIALVGGGRDAEQARAAFDACCRLAREHTGLLLLVDAAMAHRARLWRAADAAGVTGSLTLVERLEDRRDLALRADVVVCPESRGEHRTLLLDAMGAALPVVARPDEANGALVDHVTARLVSGDAAAWHAALSALLTDHTAARDLGTSARRFVKDERRWSAFTAVIADLYEWLRADEPIAYTNSASVTRAR
jgi:hypothetical protein